MRLTEFWSRMEHALGADYYRHWAATTVLGELGGRTVDEALAAGDDPKHVWRGVWSALELPPAQK